MPDNNSFKTNLLNLNLILNKADIKEGQAVADLGCGKFGYFAFLAATKVGERGRVYAVDVVKSNLELVKKEATNRHLNNLQTVWSDLEVPKATKIDSKSLDFVFLANTLHTAKDPLKIMSEAVRMLKTGGKLIIIDWKKIAAPMGPKKESKLDVALLTAAAKKIGLYPEEEFQAGPYHFGLVLLKP